MRQDIKTCHCDTCLFCITYTCDQCIAKPAICANYIKSNGTATANNNETSVLMDQSGQYHLQRNLYPSFLRRPWKMNNGRMKITVAGKYFNEPYTRENKK